MDRSLERRVGVRKALYRTVAAIHVAVTILGAAGAAASQSQAGNAVVEAQRLRDTGNFAAAARLLWLQLAQNPDDGEAARLLAQTLYWLKDLAAARAAYQRALVRHPEDTTVRLQYARMLAETGERTPARELLAPLLNGPATRAEAETLLGLLAYWEGDLTAARDRFITALQANPNQEEARRQLGEILAASASWVRLSSLGWHDDQPLDRLALGLEAGWFATPLTEVRGRVQPTQYQFDGSTRTVGTAEIGISHYVPPARLEMELAAGGVRRSYAGNALDWTGRVALGIRLPRHVALRVRLERTPYFYTLASLDTPIMVESATGLLRWDEPRGWLGEAAYQYQRYPDENAIRTVYGWMLAPLVHRRGGGVQIGYAFAASDADASRFVLASPTQPYAPTDPRFSTVGHYAPYYTPSHLVTHSAIGALTLGPARGVTLHVDGSYGVRAVDDAPVFVVSAGQVVLSAYSRTFSPWSVRSSLEIPLRGRLTLTPTGEIGRTPFYAWATGGLQLTYRFAAVPPGRAGSP